MERNVANLGRDPSLHSPVLESFYHVSFAYQSESERNPQRYVTSTHY